MGCKPSPQSTQHWEINVCRGFQIKPKLSWNCCFCPMITQRWPRSVLAPMFSCPVKRTQMFECDPGEDAFVSNSDDSLERQWKTSGWGPHVKTIRSGICLEMEKWFNPQEHPWALFNSLIKETNSYTKIKISLGHAFCFPADIVNLSTLAGLLKLKPLLFVQTGKRSRADPPNLYLD